MWRIVLVLISVSMLFLSIVTAAGAASLTINNAGNGKFVIQANDLQNIGSIEFELVYDTSIFTPPNPLSGVSQGDAFGSFQFNTNNPGRIRIVAINLTPVNGTVTIATVFFPGVKGVVGKSALVISNLYTYTADPSTQKVAIEPKGLPDAQETPPETPLPADNTGTREPQPTNQPTAGTGSTSTGTPVYLGTVTASATGQDATAGEAPRKSSEADTQQSAATPPTPPTNEPSDSSRTGAAVEEAPVAPKPPAKAVKLPEYRSVLSRFRDFKGEKTPEALKLLVTGASQPGLRQEPAVVLSDGKAAVKVYIEFPGETKKSPNFALNGAKLVSLTHDGLTWTVEAVPNAKTFDASVTVLYDDNVSEVPLTVAPPLDAAVRKTLPLDDTGFVLFLKERGTDKALRFDLDGDGARTYIDDYIYTVNYLASLGKTPAKPKSK